MFEHMLFTVAYLMVILIVVLVFGYAGYWVVAKMLDLDGDE